MGQYESFPRLTLNEAEWQRARIQKGKANGIN
jgi:hypothetical protein